MSSHPCLESQNIDENKKWILEAEFICHVMVQIGSASSATEILGFCNNSVMKFFIYKIDGTNFL